MNCNHTQGFFGACYQPLTVKNSIYGPEFANQVTQICTQLIENLHTGIRFVVTGHDESTGLDCVEVHLNLKTPAGFYIQFIVDAAGEGAPLPTPEEALSNVEFAQMLQSMLPLAKSIGEVASTRGKNHDD